jgi:WD40 repeat protein
MKSDELPLLELFTRLRQAGLPLGVNEYQLVLRALQSGFGIPDQEALARLCSTLWIKSAEDKLLFDYHFAEVMAEDIKQMRVEDDVALTPAIESPKNPLIALWRTISLPTRWALGGTLVLVTGVALWSVRPTCPYFTSKPQEFVEEGKKKYLYEIKACLAHPTNRVEIKALQTRPWLALLEGKQNGTAVLGVTDGGSFDIDHYSTRLWDLQGKQLNANLKISKISFSPNGQHLVIGLDDGTARLWDLQGKQLSNFGNLKIGDISFSPNGQHLITRLYDKKVRLWDLQGKQLSNFGNLKISKISNHQPFYDTFFEIASSISFISDGPYLFAKLDDRTVRLWDLRGKPLADFGNLKIRSIRFSPNRQYLITRLYDEKVRLWDLQGKPLADFDNLKIRDIRFSPNKQHLVTELDDRTVRLWDLQGKPLFDFGNLKIRDISFSSNGQHLVAKLDDGTARLWDLQGKPLSDFGNLKM